MLASSIAAFGCPPREGWHPCGHRDMRLPLRQIRRDRRRVRTTDNRRPVRLPSVRPGLCSPGGLGPACCSRAQPRPAPCRLPRSLPASSKAGGPLQAIPCSQPQPCGCAIRYRKDASLRLLQPTVPNEHPPDRSIPGCSLASSSLRPRLRDHRLILGQWPHESRAWEPRTRLPDEPPSGASLDGDSPASASAATLTCASEACAPKVIGHPTPRSPGGASIVAPLRRASRSGRFQPRTEHAT